MVIINLINVKSHLQTMGIIIGSSTWMDELSTKLTSYLTFQGWSYIQDEDALSIQCEEGTVIPSNITDFGELV